MVIKSEIAPNAKLIMVFDNTMSHSRLRFDAGTLWAEDKIQQPTILLLAYTCRIFGEAAWKKRSKKLNADKGYQEGLAKGFFYSSDFRCS